MEEQAVQTVHEATYPKLVCENCQYANQLHFDPKRRHLDAYICKNCDELAYWTNYFRAYELVSSTNFGMHAYAREVMHTSKLHLLDLRYAKQGAGARS
jgi:hypothetical protein